MPEKVRCQAHPLRHFPCSGRESHSHAPLKTRAFAVDWPSRRSHNLCRSFAIPPPQVTSSGTRWMRGLGDKPAQSELSAVRVKLLKDPGRLADRGGAGLTLSPNDASGGQLVGPPRRADREGARVICGYVARGGPESRTSSGRNSRRRRGHLRQREGDCAKAAYRRHNFRADVQTSPSRCKTNCTPKQSRRGGGVR